jgi:hypothetical protein
MTTVFLLTKEDIKCRPRGSHLEVITVDGSILNFTPEAAKELVSEFAAGLIMLKEKDNQEMILNFQSFQ